MAFSSLSLLILESLLLLLLLLSSPPFSVASSHLFESWCKQHGKIYASEEEKLYRHRVFQDNLDFINNHNTLRNSSYTLALNAFADLTHHEFKTTRLGFGGLTLRSDSRDVVIERPLVDVPDSVDWRKKGAVTPVKDQGNCGQVSIKAEDQIQQLHDVCAQVREKIEANYKAYWVAANKHKRKVIFDVRDFIWTIFPKERYLAGEFNKLKP